MNDSRMEELLEKADDIGKIILTLEYSNALRKKFPWDIDLTGHLHNYNKVDYRDNVKHI
jgi:hypothetical protein